MLIHINSHASVYFGGAQDGLMPPYYLNLPNQPLLELEPFSTFKAKMGLDNLIFLRQTHSDQGLVVAKDNQKTIRPFKIEGDYLVTDLKRVGIGVMTADCLPIVVYDNRNNVVSVIHAGWRGSVLGVAIKALECMQEEYTTQLNDVSVFFGPSALVCCYEVSLDFEANLEGLSWIDKQQVLVQKNNKTFFDVALFNQLQLEAAGIHKESVSRQYNQCTMCDPSFYSHRRDGDKAGRQMTVISLI